MPDVKEYTLKLDHLTCIRIVEGDSEVNYVRLQVDLDDVVNEALPNDGPYEMTLGSSWPLEEYTGLEFHKTAKVTLYVEKPSGRLEIGSVTLRGGELVPEPIPFEREGGLFELFAMVD